MKSFIELNPHGIITINKKGIIDGANSKALDVLKNYKLDTYKIHIDKLIGPGKSYKKDLCVPDFNNDTACKVQKVLRDKNGERVNAEVWVKREVNGCYIGFIKDTTEDKRVQERFKEIVHMQSHEVRAPLSNVIGLANLVDLENLSKDVNMSLIKNLRISAKKMDMIIRKIVNRAMNIKPVKKTKLLLFYKYYIPFRKFIKRVFTFLKMKIQALLIFLRLRAQPERIIGREKTFYPARLNATENTADQTFTATQPALVVEASLRRHRSPRAHMTY